MRLFTKIGGYNGSSTRAELGAEIVAIGSHGPVHIGSDSKVFVDKANDIIKSIANGTPWSKPWALESDGDLWEHFYRAVSSKGHEAIRITKVEGHAIEKHIQDGISTEEHKKGNDIADSVADEGVRVYGKDLVKAAAKLSNRHDHYQQLMIQVSHHIISRSGGLHDSS